jgi:DNA-binding PadR family transcriptional regulator
MPKGDWLGEFELCVLLGIAHGDGPAYGVRIRRDIHTRAGRDVSIGAVYATLARLEAKGLVASSLAASRPVPGGRARRAFRLTPAGRRALSASTAMLTRMIVGSQPVKAR